MTEIPLCFGSSCARSCQIQVALEQQRLRVEVRRQESEASSTIAELRAQLQTATAQAGAAQSGYQESRNQVNQVAERSREQARKIINETVIEND
eukprot:COSAG01_NODE_2616_length_7374_cov_8.288031_7_plen_94_part_00